MQPANVLIEAADFRFDPYNFVLWAFPWKSGPLANESGPRAWQEKFLVELGERLANGEVNAFEAIREAVASGHGPGKSTMVAWLTLWAMWTFEDTRGIITAGTGKQLETKTKPEIAKWFNMAIGREFFDLKAESLRSILPGHGDTWRIDLLTWSETSIDTFQGLHNKGKRVVLLFDEASAIANPVWEVSMGALTDEATETVWCAFGNPVHPTGGFRDCFGKFRHRWHTTHIDSRTVEGTNKAFLNQIVEDYGEDSDVARIRVRGLFPRSSVMQFISSDAVFASQKIEARSNIEDPLIMALDIARGGDDNCVIRFRRGLDARVIKPIKIPGSEVKDSMRLVSLVLKVLEEHKPDAFFGDATGVGGPVLDRIKQLGHRVIQVQFGGSSPDSKYADMASYMWGRMRDWVYAGGAIDDDPVLYSDLTDRQYGHNARDQLKLESKDQMKSRGVASPDDGDALAMTFAYPVAAKSVAPYAAAGRQQSNVRRDWDPSA